MHPRYFSPLLLAALLAGCAQGGGSAAKAAASATTAPSPFTTAPSPSTLPTARPTATRAAPPTAAPPKAAPPKAAPPETAAVASPKAAPPKAAPAPRATAVRHQFPIHGCRPTYGHSHHDYPATDIFAARGCLVVSPVSGRIDEVSTVDRWNSSTNKGADRGGLTFSVIGDDGVRYYGSHLQTLRVHAGQRVNAGTTVGSVGNSGDARGIATHLHFGLSWPTRHGIWWVRRGEVYPWPYLDSWKAGGNKNPATAVAAEHRRQGDVPPCRIDC